MCSNHEPSFSLADRLVPWDQLSTSAASGPWNFVPEVLKVGPEGTKSAALKCLLIMRITSSWKQSRLTHHPVVSSETPPGRDPRATPAKLPSLRAAPQHWRQTLLFQMGSPNHPLKNNHRRHFPGGPGANTSTAAAKSLQSCPTLCDPIDGSPPGSPVPAVLQARTLEWVAISFSNAWKWKVKVRSLSHVWLIASDYDCSPPGSSVHGIFQTRILEWGAIAFSRG